MIEPDDIAWSWPGALVWSVLIACVALVLIFAPPMKPAQIICPEPGTCCGTVDMKEVKP